MLPASMLGDYSTSAPSTPSCFPCHTDLLGNLFLTTSLIDLPFFLFILSGPSYRPSCPPRCSVTTQECISDALGIFSSSFRSIGSLLLIGRHSTSLCSAKTLHRSAAKLNYSFLFFRLTCMLFVLSIALRLRHDLYKVTARTPRSGACETWVHLGPHRPGSRPSLTSRSGLPEDTPTCHWSQLT
jgi:hypothetical protein